MRDATTKRLTSAPFWVGAVRWSPNGRDLAFSASEPGAFVRLFLAPVDAGTPRELKVGNFNVGSVRWSPDGRAIVFNSTLNNPGSSTVRSVDLNTETTTPIPELESLQGPVRSPDGQYLAATTLLGDKLLLFDFATQKWSDLVATPVGDLHWSSDRKFIYFDNGYNADSAVYRLHLADRKVEQIVRLKDFRRVVIPWSTWFGLTPDGDILLMHDTGSQEVYALDLDAS